MDKLHDDDNDNAPTNPPEHDALLPDQAHVLNPAASPEHDSPEEAAWDDRPESGNETRLDPHTAADAIWDDIEARVTDQTSDASHDHDVSAEDSGGVIAEDHAAPAWTIEGLEQLNRELEAASFPGFEEFNGIHGTPIEDLNLWDQQDQPFSCAVATTNMLFRSCGYDIGETNLAELFQSQGIYDPAMGTNLHQIADTLNHAVAQTDLSVEAVEINQFTEQSLEALLDNGVRPLVAVNASELYSPAQRFLNSIGVIPNAGHAVQLTGIIRSAEGNFAMVNDPGFPDGGGRVIPLDVFMSAASKLGHSAVVLIPV